MAEAITLTEAKQFLKVDITDDDSLITDLIASAVDYVKTFTRRETIDSTSPARVKQALRLLIGHWYENRSAVVTGTIATEVQHALKNLLWSARVTL